MMTPAKRAKQLGAQSLNQVAEAFGCTIQNMSAKFYANPHQFDIIVLGVVIMERMKYQDKTVSSLQFGSFEEDAYGEQMI